MCLHCLRGVGGSLDVAQLGADRMPRGSKHLLDATRLHELGHVWTIQNVDEATRAAFLAARGLDVWQQDGVDRDHQGTEHAAEIISWGLIDIETWAARLPDSECVDLADAFRVLTGHEPLRSC